jgi:hypothetical protein
MMVDIGTPPQVKAYMIWIEHDYFF